MHDGLDGESAAVSSPGTEMVRHIQGRRRPFSDPVLDYLYAKLLHIERPPENQTVVLVNGATYRMQKGLLRRNAGYSVEQDQTRSAFGYQWKRLRYTKAAHRFQVEWFDETFPGYRHRLGEWLSPGSLVLDAGCGAGFSAIGFFGEWLRAVQYVGVDISDSIDQAVRNFRDKGFPGDFLQDDITQLPFGEGGFDFIFSPGVLQHTDSVAHSLSQLSRHLRRGGRLLLWVYHRQPPLRALTDLYIRDHLSKFDNHRASHVLTPLTNFGKALAELHVEVAVPEDIPMLGIPAGRYDLQRLIYHYVLKCFYNPSLGIARSNMQNFDWFRPRNAHTHTVDEIQAYCRSARLCIEYTRSTVSGISVVARKT